MHICYKVGFGLVGCYLDDNQSGPQRFTTRKYLADAIRWELDFYGFPKSCFDEVNIKRLWGAIKRAKSASSYTFHIHHDQNVLTFYGLTRKEELEEIAGNLDEDEEDRRLAREELQKHY